MTTKKFTVSDSFKKTSRIVGYLLVSGLLGYVLAEYVMKDPALAVIFAPAINFVLYTIAEELKGEGYIRALKG